MKSIKMFKMNITGKDSQKADFRQKFLKQTVTRDRRQIYISGEVHDKVSRYLRVIGEGKTSMIAYLNNIIISHMEENKDTINDLYRDNIDRGNPV